MILDKITIVIQPLNIFGYPTTDTVQLHIQLKTGRGTYEFHQVVSIDAFTTMFDTVWELTGKQIAYQMRGQINERNLP